MLVSIIQSINVKVQQRRQKQTEEIEGEERRTELRRGEMWGISTPESSEEAKEAADGSSKWIFLVCNEATSAASAVACVDFKGLDEEGDREETEEVERWKRLEVGKERK